MDLFGSRWIDSIEEVFEASFILIVGKVNELFKLFLETVSQETVMDASHSGHIDADYSKVLHLLSGKSGTDKVDAGAKPAVLRSALLKTNITTCFQLGHQTMNVLLGHFVYFFLEAVIDGI